MHKGSMRERFYQLQEAVVKQNEDNPARGYDGFMLVKCLTEEVQELTEAIQTENPTNVACEMGDIQYLLFRFADLTGIDLLDACEMKRVRNELKYINGLSKEQGKILYQHMGGDERFINAYTEIVEEKEDYDQKTTTG